MIDEQFPGKYVFTVKDEKIILEKSRGKKLDPAFGKIYAYALYKSKYPGVKIDQPVGGYYKPDLVARDESGKVLFWAECGNVKRPKLAKLLKKYPQVHFVFLKIQSRIGETARILEELVKELKRSAPVELVLVPGEVAKYISPEGVVSIRREDCKITSFSTGT